MLLSSERLDLEIHTTHAGPCRRHLEAYRRRQRLLRIYLGAARVTVGEVDDNSVGVTIDFSSEFDRQSVALPGRRSTPIQADPDSIPLNSLCAESLQAITPSL